MPEDCGVQALLEAPGAPLAQKPTGGPQGLIGADDASGTNAVHLRETNLFLVHKTDTANDGAAAVLASSRAPGEKVAAAGRVRRLHPCLNRCPRRQNAGARLPRVRRSGQSRTIDPGIKITFPEDEGAPAVGPTGALPRDRRARATKGGLDGRP
jgi:hypothetical protein